MNVDGLKSDDEKNSKRIYMQYSRATESSRVERPLHYETAR